MIHNFPEPKNKFMKSNYLRGREKLCIKPTHSQKGSSAKTARKSIDRNSSPRAFPSDR